MGRLRAPGRWRRSRYRRPVLRCNRRRCTCSQPGQNTFPPGSNAFGPPAVAPNEWSSPIAPVAPAERPSAPPAGAGQYVAAIAVGVLLAVLIGVGGFYGWRKRHAPVAEAVPTVVTPVPMGQVAPGGATGTATATTAAATASVAPAGTASGDIAFRIVPSEAMLSVDGQDLARDLRTVPRPAMGKTVTVVARAKGFEDVTILIDFFTTSPMELTLKPAAAGGPTVTDPAPPAAEEVKNPRRIRRRRTRSRASPPAIRRSRRTPSEPDSRLALVTTSPLALSCLHEATSAETRLGRPARPRPRARDGACVARAARRAAPRTRRPTRPPSRRASSTSRERRPSSRSATRKPRCTSRRPRRSGRAPVALYTAGLAWDLASAPERAADAYGRALEVGGLDPKQTALAKDRVAQLEKTLGTVAVAAPEGWRVQLDTFTEVPTPARLHAARRASTRSACARRASRSSAVT